MKIDQVYHKEGTWYCLPTGKCPEEPTWEGNDEEDYCCSKQLCDVEDDTCDCALQHHSYKEALAAALKEAKPFEDQQHIETLVYGHPSQLIDNRPVNYFSWKDKLKDGLYSIPETEVEIVEVPEHQSGIDGSGPPYSKVDFEKVARIVTPTSERKKESQTAVEMLERFGITEDSTDSWFYEQVVRAMDEHKNQDGFPFEINVAGFKGRFQTIEDAEAFKARCIYYQNKFKSEPLNESEQQSTIKELVEALEESRDYCYRVDPELFSKIDSLVSKVKSKLSTEDLVRDSEFNLPAACVFQLQQIALADDDMVKLPGAAENYRYIARHILELFTITRKS